MYIAKCVVYAEKYQLLSMRIQTNMTDFYLRLFIAVVLVHLILTACHFLRSRIVRYKKQPSTPAFDSDPSLFQIAAAFGSTGLFIFYCGTPWGIQLGDALYDKSLAWALAIPAILILHCSLVFSRLP